MFNIGDTVEDHPTAPRSIYLAIGHMPKDYQLKIMAAMEQLELAGVPSAPLLHLPRTRPFDMQKVVAMMTPTGRDDAPRNKNRGPAPRRAWPLPK